MPTPNAPANRAGAFDGEQARTGYAPCPAASGSGNIDLTRPLQPGEALHGQKT